MLPPSDHLSHSPSLVHILSYLNIDDVEDCLLVSRRFCYIIRRNWDKMPRSVGVNLRHHEIIDVEEGVSVMIWCRHRRSNKRLMNILIETKGIRVINCDFRGALESFKDSLVKKSISSIEMGIEAVFKPLFAHYAITTIQDFWRVSPVTVKWFAQVATIFGASQSKCDLLSLFSVRDLKHKLQNFEGNKVLLGLLSNVLEHLELLLQSFRAVDFLVHPTLVTVAVALIEKYIKGWIAGSLLARGRLQLMHSATVPLHGTRYIYNSVVASLDYGTVYFTSRAYFEGSKDFELYIRRPSDHMVLAIFYGHSIEIGHIHNYYDSLESIQRTNK